MMGAESTHFDLEEKVDVDLEDGYQSTSSSGGSHISTCSASSDSFHSIGSTSVRDPDPARIPDTNSLSPGQYPWIPTNTNTIDFYREALMASKTAAEEGDARSSEARALAAIFGSFDSYRLKPIENLESQLASRELEAPHTYYDLTTKNLTYKVQVRSRGQAFTQKILLDNITTEARHGEVLAIMGPSGASKTTFLDALAGRISRRSLTGSLLVNGQPMTTKFKRISGYVMQEDVHFPMLTARETLMYSARLRLPSTMSRDEKKRRVDSILDLLGLKECADTRIGNEEIGGVSGGERRRISIALDLIHEPMVLFLDEPTSGLDSTSALQVMESLHKLAKERNRTIILTIHQPSYRILDTIDNCLVLSKGRVVYQGHHNDMIKFFSNMGFVKPEHVTVVEYMMDKIEECACNGDLAILQSEEQLTSTLPVISQARSQGQRRRYSDGRERELSSYDYKLDLDEEEPVTVSNDNQMIGFGSLRADSDAQVKFANPWWKETCVLGERNFKNSIRTRTMFLSRIFVILMTSLILATLFYGSDRDWDGIRQRQVFFAFSVAVLVFTSCEAMPMFLLERRIFIRETSRGAYRAACYVISHSFTVLPFMLLLAVLSTVTSYFPIGLVMGRGGPVLFFSLATFLILSIGNAFVAFISGLAPDFMAGLIIFGASSAYQFLFSGFFIQRHNIPRYWLWLHYGSFFKYGYEALVVNEFRNLPGHLWAPAVTSQTVLDTLDIKQDYRHQWFNIIYLFGFFVGYRFLFYLTLRFKTNNIRK